jgi:2-hydroxychromene-2-carboxylate isomerase
MSSTEQPKSIEFFFDIMCPYAYQTSVWIRDVQEQVGFDISWRFFSLEEINREEGKKHPYERDFVLQHGYADKTTTGAERFTKSVAKHCMSMADVFMIATLRLS